MSTNTLSGGTFQDIEGNPIANGTVKMHISQPATASSGTVQVVVKNIEILLDASGNVQTYPAQAVWPNDQLSPANTYYMVTVYSSKGQIVWGPNAQQVLSTPAPFNISAWIPGNPA